MKEIRMTKWEPSNSLIERKLKLPLKKYQTPTNKERY